MTNNSPWHLIDRLLACLLMSLELMKLITMRKYTRPAVYAIYLVSVTIAIGCFSKSQQSQKNLDTDGFIFWHCGWHCYPILCTAVVAFERWITSQYGEYVAMECRACKKGEGGGMLLSSIVMEYLYGDEGKYERKQPKWKHK